MDDRVSAPTHVVVHIRGVSGARRPQVGRRRRGRALECVLVRRCWPRSNVAEALWIGRFFGPLCPAPCTLCPDPIGILSRRGLRRGRGDLEVALYPVPCCASRSASLAPRRAAAHQGTAGCDTRQGSCPHPGGCAAAVICTRAGRSAGVRGCARVVRGTGEALARRCARGPSWQRRRWLLLLAHLLARAASRAH